MKSSAKIKGFTLVELLVGIAILAAMAALSVSAYPTFSQQLGVSTESYKMLAYMREAQVYGVAGYTEPGIKVVYGIQVEKATNKLSRVKWQNPTANDNQSYLTNLISAGELDFNIGDKFEIDKICSITNAINSCESGAIGNYEKGFILFRRPNPEARIIATTGTLVQPSPSDNKGFEKMEVHIRSKKTTEFVKKIVILQTGQMYID